MSRSRDHFRGIGQGHIYLEYTWGDIFRKILITQYVHAPLMKYNFICHSILFNNYENRVLFYCIYEVIDTVYWSCEENRTQVKNQEPQKKCIKTVSESAITRKCTFDEKNGNSFTFSFCEVVSSAFFYHYYYSVCVACEGNFLFRFSF